MKTDLSTFVKIKASLAKNFHIQPSEVDKMPMWEYELFITYLNEMVKEENDKQEAESKKYNINDYKKMSDPKNYQKSFDNSMKSYSNIGNMKF
jgi:hypothetical protein